MGVKQTPAQPIPTGKFSASLNAAQSSSFTALNTGWMTQGTSGTSLYHAVSAAKVNGAIKPAESPAVKALRAGWMRKKAEVFAGKQHVPDSEDPSTVNHLDWYESTNFVIPYPGEKKVRPASDFRKSAPARDGDDD